MCKRRINSQKRTGDQNYKSISGYTEKQIFKWSICWELDFSTNGIPYATDNTSASRCLCGQRHPQIWCGSDKRVATLTTLASCAEEIDIKTQCNGLSLPGSYIFQVSWKSVEGSRSCRGSKIALSHWLGPWLIQQLVLPYKPWLCTIVADVASPRHLLSVGQNEPIARNDWLIGV